MWRYLVGGIAALLMVAAGWLLFNGQASPEPGARRALLPALGSAAAPPAAGGDAALPDVLPEAPARSREQKRFDRYDKDRDTTITRDEYLTARRKAFAKLDANGDGRLTFDEWAAKTATRFATADRDRSGTLSATEFATTAPKRRATTARCACPAPAAQDDGS